jgi:hypothetical protein
MAIYELTSDSLRLIDETSFAKAGVKERADLQRLLRSQIEIVSPGTLVIAEEFGEWQDSRRRIDLLGIDKDANLVVIELKRNEDGEEMELQAIRYAAMVSTMTFDKAAEVYTNYLARISSPASAQESLLAFLGWEEPNEDQFAQDVKIVLVSADFSKEVTTAVMWLNERSLDIRCVRIKPYRDAGKVLVDVQQIIPLPEAAEYQIKIREKERKERQDRVSQSVREYISEEEFVSECEEKCKPPERDIAKQLIAWAHRNGLHDCFRRGKKGAVCIPIVEHGTVRYYPFSLRSNGDISIQIRWLKDRVPFNDLQMRTELLQRLRSIPDLRETNMALEGYPGFNLTNLADPSVLESFISTLNWIVQEIKNSPTNEP